MPGEAAGVAAVDRALSLLAAFDDGMPTLSLAALAERTGLYKSTILRLAASLEAAGHLRRLSTGHYQLGPQLLRLGSLYQGAFRLGDFVEPELDRLADATGESSAFYIRDGDQKLCLYRVNSTQHVVLRFIQPGYRTALTAGASGMILLAFTEPGRPELDALRARPLTVSLERREKDTGAMACPVFGVHQAIQGALVLAGPLTRFQPADIARVAPVLLESAIRLTVQLGGNAAPLEALRGQPPTSV